MNHFVFYQKYRPDDFNKIIGQDQTVSILKKAIAEQRFPHAVIFFGPHGVGKTSAARIFAKAINCQKPNLDNCCNQCHSCQLINHNQTQDLIEMDGASNNGVEHIRQIVNQSNYLPTSLKFRVYIIDEAHMLTKEAWNAMLKLLEEPAKHLVFVFASTEIYKFPLTIISRCQKFNFTKISPTLAKKFLLKIIQEEKITISNEAVDGIVALADGSLRDLCNIIDQLSHLNGKKIDTTLLYDSFVILNLATKIAFFHALLKADLIFLNNQINFYDQKGINFYKLALEISEFFFELLVSYKSDNVNFYKNFTTDDLTKLRIYDYEFLLVVANVWNDHITQLKNNDEQKVFFKNICLKIIGLFTKQDDVKKDISSKNKKKNSFSQDINQKEEIITKKQTNINQVDNSFCIKTNQPTVFKKNMNQSQSVIKDQQVFSYNDQLSDSNPLIKASCKNQQLVTIIDIESKQEFLSLFNCIVADENHKEKVFKIYQQQTVEQYFLALYRYYVNVKYVLRKQHQNNLTSLIQKLVDASLVNIIIDFVFAQNKKSFNWKYAQKITNDFIIQQIIDLNTAYVFLTKIISDQITLKNKQKNTKTKVSLRQISFFHDPSRISWLQRKKIFNHYQKYSTKEYWDILVQHECYQTFQKHELTQISEVINQLNNDVFVKLILDFNFHHQNQTWSLSQIKQTLSELKNKGTLEKACDFLRMQQQKLLFSFKIPESKPSDTINEQILKLLRNTVELDDVFLMNFVRIYRNNDADMVAKISLFLKNLSLKAPELTEVLNVLTYYSTIVCASANGVVLAIKDNNFVADVFDFNNNVFFLNIIGQVFGKLLYFGAISDELKNVTNQFDVLFQKHSIFNDLTDICLSFENPYLKKAKAIKQLFAKVII